MRLTKLHKLDMVPHHSHSQLTIGDIMGYDDSYSDGPYPGQAEKWEAPTIDHTKEINDALNQREKEIESYRDRLSEAHQKKTTPAVVKPAPPVVPLDAQLTFWHYLNDVQYVTLNKEALTKQNTWLITNAATYLIQKNSAGFFGTKKSDEGIPTLPKTTYPECFFELAYGKIPNAILEQILAFFREIMKRHNDAEAFIQVYWDKTESKYIIHVPKQRISKAAVSYTAEDNLNVKDSSRYVFVYECHSHNSMGAFWSGTDDRDEKELRIYGVFGQLNKEAYANKHRFFVGEEQIDVDISGVFDISEETTNQYLVTHNGKQHLVPADKLKLDDKPKYIITKEDGEKIYVNVESVVLHKAKVEYPQSWFESINVPLPVVHGGGHTRPITAYGERRTSPSFGTRDESTRRGIDTRSAFLNDQNFDRDGFPLEEVDSMVVETAEEISDCVQNLMDLTNGFDDLSTTLMFIEELEGANCLYELHKSMSDYIGMYHNKVDDLSLP